MQQKRVSADLLNAMNTGRFIQTIQEHIDESMATGMNDLNLIKQQSSRYDKAKRELRKLGVKTEDCPLDVSSLEAD